MKENDIYSELSSIRNLMERSTKFISLSGLSGILAGIYALVGAFLVLRLISPGSMTELGRVNVGASSILKPVFLIALTVLILSLVTGLGLTIRQANKKGQNVWNPVSKRLLVNMAVPLIAGGLFILILIQREYYEIIAAACLIFYGLALISASNYTFSDVKWLGLCEVFLGLIAALLPAYGLIFWSIGFGILHILYGSIMHFKYNQ